MEKSIEYIAGILDSGCHVAIEKQQNVYRGVITFHRQNRAVLEVVVQKFGGRIYPAKGGY